MNFNNNSPIYKQLCELFILKLINNEINIGDKMISIREAALEYKLNPNTVVNAFKELENKNILITKRGLGSYITEDASIISTLKSEYTHNIVDNFIEKMNKMGFNKEEIKKIIDERSINE